MFQPSVSCFTMTFLNTFKYLLSTYYSFTHNGPLQYRFLPPTVTIIVYIKVILTLVGAPSEVINTPSYTDTA